jgi:hypothetical protein
MAGSKSPMCNISKVWPARLLAAMMALALVAACAIGAYAHAAGHALPVAEHAEVGTADHAGHHHAPVMKAAAVEPGPVGHSHDGDGTGHGHLDYCDTICHGGQAILPPDALDLPLPHSMPVIGSVAAFDGAEPGGLDRPPKTARSA